MSATTVVLYGVVLGLWSYSIYRDGGIGLGARFLFGLNMTLFFLVGPALAQLQPPTLPRPMDVPTEPAAQLALWGLLVYVVAAYWVFPWASRQTRSPASRLTALLKKPGWAETQRVLGWWLFGIGAGSLALNSFMFSLPTIRAVWSTVNSLAETGLLLVCLSALGTRQYGRIFGALALLALYSLLTSAVGGHIGFQFLKGLFLLCVIFLGHRFMLYRVGLVLLVGMATFIPYQQWLIGRQQLRGAIAEELPLQERLTIVVGIFADPFVVLNEQESVASAYANRGDYAELLAAAMQHTPAVEPYANGETLLELFIALIPRIFWPDKPYRLGGSAIATRFTGIPYADDTSIAVSFLFELYVNFSIEGVLIGMFLLGLALAWLERKFYTCADKYHWGMLGVIACMWVIGLEAHVISMMMMMIPPGLLVAWGAGKLIPLARDRARRAQLGTEPGIGKRRWQPQPVRNNRQSRP